MLGKRKLIIEPAWCKGCGICVAFCPQEALELVNGKVTVTTLSDDEMPAAYAKFGLKK